MKLWLLTFKTPAGRAIRRKVKARSREEASGPCWRVLLLDYPSAALLSCEETLAFDGEYSHDGLCAEMIRRAPRFGGVAAHFPGKVRTRPHALGKWRATPWSGFVASFWAPEVFFAGPWPATSYTREPYGWYINGGTRPSLDFCVSDAIGRARRVPPGVARIGGERAQPFWSPELPEVMESTRHSSERTYFAPCGPRDGEKPWRPIRGIALALLLLCLALPYGAQ